MLSQTIQAFVYSLKSIETQKHYLLNIRYFEKWHKNKVDSLLQTDSKIIEKTLIDYIVSMRKQNLSYNYIKSRISPIIVFLELNDVTVNKKKIARFYPENIKTIEDEAYTRVDIQKMLQYASYRVKVIILIYSSTGIRKATLADLKLKHLQKMDNNSVYKFTIYENTKDEYITFCTPECADAIDQYIEKRKTDGEKITKESFLIRNDYDSKNGGAGSTYGVRNPKPVNIGGLTMLIATLLERVNLRTKNHVTENYKYKRQSKATFHAFRKYFNTCLANCDVNVTIKEMLMGHSVGLDDSYYKPNEKQLIAEYSKATNELTINEENRLRTELDIMKEKQDKIDMLLSRIELMEKQFGEASKLAK